jgi:hypothetical protein
MRRHLSFITILAFIFSFLINCKKKEEPVPVPVPYVDPCTYTSSYRLVQQYEVISDTLSPTKLFPDVFLSKFCPGNKAPVSVELNGLSLNSIPFHLQYGWWTTTGDIITESISPPYIWNLTGTDQYLSFTETITDSLPRFTSYAQMPDTISRSAVTELQLSFVNTNEVEIVIDALDNRPIGYTQEYWWLGNPSISSPTFGILFNSSMTAASHSSLVVTCSKTYTKTINNKPMTFSLRSKYKKQIYFKN